MARKEAGVVMTIIKHEIKKIVMFPAIIVFVVLSILLNITVISTMQNSYANFIADVSHFTGVHLGDEFNHRVAELEPSAYTNLLDAQTGNRHDPLYGYNTQYLADIAVELLELGGMAERLMRSKYERFQYAVNARQSSGDSMTLYFAESTPRQHEALFRVTMGLLLFQVIILATLIILLSIGYENSYKTNFVVYSTKTGRKIIRHKLIAGVVISLGAYILLTTITLAFYLTLNPMGGIWGSSVSSGFNIIRDGAMTRPFVTWHSLTVFEYLLASIGISIGLILCFALIAYAVSLLIKNTYIGLLVIVAINGLLLIIPSHSPFAMVNFIIVKSPICLVVLHDLWFTDGGMDVILPHFETIGVIGSLVILAPISMLSTLRFKRECVH